VVMIGPGWECVDSRFGWECGVDRARVGVW